MAAGSQLFDLEHSTAIHKLREGTRSDASLAATTKHGVMALPGGFKIVPARPEDSDRIETYMRKHFYRFEPMNMSLGITEGHRCTDRVLPLENLDEGLSLIAVTTTDDGEEQIVGVCLNGEDKPEDDFQFTFTDECEKFKKIITCVMKVHKNSDIFEKTGVKKALDIYILSVDPEFRRNGIGRALVEHSICVAKEKGYPLVTVMCSSFYTAKIAEALNMECVYQIRYDEYLDENGIPVLMPPKPHEEIRVFTLLI